MNKERDLISALKDWEIKEKIRRGRAWLSLHNKEVCGIISMWSYDEDRWSYNLKFYELIVEEATKRGIDEKEAWQFDDKLRVGDMTPEEVLFLIMEFEKDWKEVK
jgi:hypothetical protein